MSKCISHIRITPKMYDFRTSTIDDTEISWLWRHTCVDLKLDLFRMFLSISCLFLSQDWRMSDCSYSSHNQKFLLSELFCHALHWQGDSLLVGRLVFTPFMCAAMSVQNAVALAVWSQSRIKCFPLISRNSSITEFSLYTHLSSRPRLTQRTFVQWRIWPHSGFVLLERSLIEVNQFWNFETTVTTFHTYWNFTHNFS
jgi:hypothetical protein